MIKLNDDDSERGWYTAKFACDRRNERLVSFTDYEDYHQILQFYKHKGNKVPRVH